MTFRFASLGSGSSGNATLVCHGEQCVLIDCGFSAKEARSRCVRIGIDERQIAAILVTHEHSDHAKGAAQLAKQLSVPLYCSRGTAMASGFELSRVHFLRAEQCETIAGFDVLPVTVPHDAREPTQFIISVSGLKLGVLTDLGSITPHIIAAYSACDALLVEANHDQHMLARGPYPISLQRRVGGDWGHLNNQQTLSFLQSLDLGRMQHLVIAHISQKNNSLACVQTVLASLLNAPFSCTFACQHEGVNWLSIEQRH